MFGLPINGARHALRPLARSSHAESYVLLVGIGLLGVYFGARLHSLLFSQIALDEFDTVRAGVTGTTGNLWNNDSDVDVSLWGKARIKAYRAALGLKFQPPIAVLNIPGVGLRAPVFEGTDALTLNRGLGRIPGTALPGSDGNLGIAGHRDGFFRGLKDIKPGDTVEVDTRLETDIYIVDLTKIVGPHDVSVLEDQPVPTLTLVTCYPFYYIGDAPQRFVVRASLKHRDVLQQ